MASKTSPTVAVAYIRVSTEEQQQGPKAQRDAIERWAARQGVQVVSWHVDEGVSGAAQVADRPALLEALEGLRQHGAGLLVVARRDRLARDPMVSAMAESLARRAGGRVVSAAGEGSDGDDPASVLLRRMVDAFAEFERALIRSRTSAAMQAMRKRGQYTGGADRYGWRRVGGEYVEVPEEQAVIRQARELQAAGVGAAAIAKALGPTRRGRPWDCTGVRRLLA